VVYHDPFLGLCSHVSLLLLTLWLLVPTLRPVFEVLGKIVHHILGVVIFQCSLVEDITKRLY
jgi:hypothetical protein